MYFRFDTQNGNFIEAFEKQKSFFYKKEINGEVDTIKAANDIYSHSADKLFSEFGIKVGTIIRPPLGYGEKHCEQNLAVDDPVALTRTYSKLPIANLADKENQDRKDAMKAIDEQAAVVRRSYVPDQLLEEEYRRTEIVVQAWVDAGSDDENIPAALQSEMDARGTTSAVASATILGLANAMNGILDSVRDIRLKGKVAVEDALGQDIESTKQTYINQLITLLPEE